ncbi:MAG TPA: MEDS domain-containing protein [Candidatus Limnocylindria bacterium]|nr:MEDS domain-containing protein [Candidatus Limnocylindria bacterium]
MTRATLGFGDLQVDVPSHVCLFYSSDEELRGRLGFLAHSLDDPAQVAVLFGKQDRLEQVLGYIGEDFGRDVAADLKAGHIVLVNGVHDPDALLGAIGAALDAAVARGTKLIRFLGFIGWGDMDWPASEDLMVFEAKVTEAVKSYPAVVVCTYNIEKLPGSVLIFAGIETHPLTILGTTLCENPHYVPFAEYMERRGRPTIAERQRNLGGVKIGPLG